MTMFAEAYIGYDQTEEEMKGRTCTCRKPG